METFVGALDIGPFLTLSSRSRLRHLKTSWINLPILKIWFPKMEVCSVIILEIGQLIVLFYLLKAIGSLVQGHSNLVQVHVHPRRPTLRIPCSLSRLPMASG